MGEKKRKLLNFDVSDKEQYDAFTMLDRIRYYQTRFITKLVSDFKKQNNIDENTPYEELCDIVKNYIGIPANNRKIKNNLNLTQDQMNILMQLIAEHEERNPKHTYTVRENTNIKNSSAETHNLPDSSNEDENNADMVNMMLNGFSSMLEE